MTTENKPDWKDAPDWANWAAQDYDGRWFWFENKPIAGFNVFMAEGRMEPVKKVNTKWKQTTQQRPTQ
jgi:hypothetical protein